MPQIVTPYLLYEDADAAVGFLTAAFGFEELMQMPLNDGDGVGHAELGLRDGRVFLGQPGGSFRSPRSLGTRTSSVYVYVDDVDAHCARARAAGAEIAEEPNDQPYGERRYMARDPEGYDWFFAAPIG
jgi:uncharacterized glyoxalase superfamily protein PhnB